MLHSMALLYYTTILTHTAMYHHILVYAGLILQYIGIYYKAIDWQILPYTGIYWHILAYTPIYCHILLTADTYNLFHLFHLFENMAVDDITLVFSISISISIHISIQVRA